MVAVATRDPEIRKVRRRLAAQVVDVGLAVPLVAAVPTGLEIRMLRTSPMDPGVVDRSSAPQGVKTSET